MNRSFFARVSCSSATEEEIHDLFQQLDGFWLQVFDCDQISEKSVDVFFYRPSWVFLKDALSIIGLSRYKWERSRER